MLRGNSTEELLAMTEWQEWLGKCHHNGPLGRLFHDIAKIYRSIASLVHVLMF